MFCIWLQEDTRRRTGDRHRKENGKRSNSASLASGRGGFQKHLEHVRKEHATLTREVEALTKHKIDLQAAVERLEAQTQPLQAELSKLKAEHKKLMQRVKVLQDREATGESQRLEHVLRIPAGWAS